MYNGSVNRAILSDVHGNLEALEAVLRDIDRRNDEGEGIREILCLGDVIGYGPNPRECLDLLRRRSKVLIAGNHELGVVEKVRTPRLGIGRATGYGGLGAREGILWAIHQLYDDRTPVAKDDDAFTRELLEGLRAPDYEQRLIHEVCERLKGPDFKTNLAQRLLKGDGEMVEKILGNPEARNLLEDFFRKLRARREGDDRVNFLSSLPKATRVEDALLVHDNPFTPGDSRYVLDGPARSQVKAGSNTYTVEQVFSDFEWKDVRYVLFGHSHFPGVYTDKKRPAAVVANPGSVGIPRGHALEATYIIWNRQAKNPRHLFRLVHLPLRQWEATGKKMEEAGLPNKLKLLADKTHKELD